MNNPHHYPRAVDIVDRKTVHHIEIPDDPIWRDVTPAACEHIARYYDQKWCDRPCIAFNLLRRGYRQWSLGRIEWPANNLYEL